MTKIPEITSYVERQRLKWFRHVKRREELKAIVEWRPEGKRLRGRPKKRRIDGIRQDLERL